MGVVHAGLQETGTIAVVVVKSVAAAGVPDVALLNATNTSSTIPKGNKQTADPDSGCGCLLLRRTMLKV